MESTTGETQPVHCADAAPVISVRSAKPTDATAWLQLRLALWPEGPEAEHRDEIGPRPYSSPRTEPGGYLGSPTCRFGRVPKGVAQTGWHTSRAGSSCRRGAAVVPAER
jgi:hypothetical protein